METNENDTTLKLLSSIDEIDYSNQTSFQIFNGEVKRIVLKCNTIDDRKVTMKSEICFYIQKYIYSHSNKSFVLLNLEHKNMMRKIPFNMKQEESILKYCLSELSNDKYVLFIIPRSLCEEEYNHLVHKLNIPIELISLEYDDSLYYKINVKHVFIEMLPDPDSITQYPQHIDAFKEEIRYLIKEKYYSYAERYCNIIIGRIFSMRKEKKMLFDDESKKQLSKLLKPIILNKTLCITLKEGDLLQKWKQYEEAIKCIEKDYYPYYKNDIDDFYLKITGRYVMYALKIKQIEKAHNALDDLKKKYDNNNEIIIQLENEIKRSPPFKTAEQLERSFIKGIMRKDINDDKKNGDVTTNKSRRINEIDYEWEISSLNVLNYLRTDLFEPGIINILNQ